MIIRNCSELLNDLVELENQISRLENALKKNCPELDLEEALKITFNNQINRKHKELSE